jgi:hypothetical protein
VFDLGCCDNKLKVMGSKMNQSLKTSKNSLSNSKDTKTSKNLVNINSKNIKNQKLSKSQQKTFKTNQKSFKNHKKISHKIPKPTAIDAIRKQVLVSPEGEERSYDHTVFFCANKRIDFLINKPGQHENFNPDILTKNLIFTVRGSHSISIVLSAFTRNFHILLGINGNNYSSLSLDGVVLANVSTVGIIDGSYQDFFLSWDNSHILISKPL